MTDAPEQAGLPSIDYARHPAYGGMFEPDPELGARAAASLGALVEEMTRIEAERAAAFGYRRGRGTAEAAALSDRGALALRLAPKLIDPLAAAAAPVVAQVRERIRRTREAGQPISFKTSQEMVGRDTHPEIWARAAAALKHSGAVQAAEAYFGGGAKFKAAAVMVNQPDQGWTTDLFRDPSIPAPPTVGFHVDSSGGCVAKAVLYLDDVGPDQGPFGFVPGSHRLEEGGLGRIRRRAFDRSALVSRAAPSRRAFLSLPTELQVKAEFGGDMPPDAPETLALLQAEQPMPGPRGQLNLFDAEAIHRGGQARAGERVVMLMSLTVPRPDAALLQAEGPRA